MSESSSSDVQRERIAALNKRRKTSTSQAAQRWTRWVHVYTSMICFVVVFFFSATGLTLNHPEWTFGISPKLTKVTGTLPANWRSGNTVDWLVVAEYMRATNGLKGSVSSHDSDTSQGSISFRGPAYGADAFIDVPKGTYELTVETQGFVGYMNDLHKGRDSPSSWKWVIDISAIFLVIVSLSGLLLQLFLRKRRSTAYGVAGVGGVVTVLMMWLAAR